MAQNAPQELALAEAGWVQDELHQVRNDVAQLAQELTRLHSLVATLTDQHRADETVLQNAALATAQAKRLQDELNQALGLLVQLQDQQKGSQEQLDVLARHGQSEEAREHQEWSDLARRLELLERQVEHWQDRQAGVDEVGRRFQESTSLINQQLQQLDQRLEAAEGKAARAIEGASRVEHTLSEVQGAILELRSDDEALTERTRVAGDVARRIETTLNEHLEELRRVELLAERIELHRAERQRLEDRALRLEESLAALATKAEEQEHLQGRLHAQAQGLASRLDTLYVQLRDQRAILVDQVRKLTGSQERTKRRQIQETEREIREMKQYVADLTDQ
jgi:chromosome segregation ATPase